MLRRVSGRRTAKSHHPEPSLLYATTSRSHWEPRHYMTEGDPVFDSSGGEVVMTAGVRRLRAKGLREVFAGAMTNARE